MTAWLRSMGAVGVKHIETQPVVLNPNGAEAALQLEAALIRTAPLLPLVTVTAPPTSTCSWHVAPRRQPFAVLLQVIGQSRRATRHVQIK